MSWLDYVKGLAYLLVGYFLDWISKLIPLVAVLGPWLSTFFGLAGLAAVIAGAVKVLETFLAQFGLEGLYGDVGKLFIVLALLYQYPPIAALGPAPFAAIAFAFLLGYLLKK